MKVKISMREALDDPQLFGPILTGASWLPWRTILIGSMGEPLSPEERIIWHSLTGRAQEPGHRVEELFAVVGRRGGKTRAASVASTYLSTMVDWSDVLSRGERGVLTYLAQNQKQARVAFGYAESLFRTVPFLASMVAKEPTQDTIELINACALEVRAASWRGLRGTTSIGVVADELAFFRSEEHAANTDKEILAAVRPALATTGGPLIAISSPYARQGELYAAWRDHYGAEGDPLILVAHGASTIFNPSLPQRVVDRALERDAVAARSEYLAHWRDDVASYVSRAQVEGVTSTGVTVRPYDYRHEYEVFVDPAGGAGSDSMTLAVGHREGDMVILDCVHELRPPFSPKEAVRIFSLITRDYDCDTIVGDRWGGDWPREAFMEHGIYYRLCPKTRTELYQEFLPHLSSGTVDLLDIPRMVNQFANLERRSGSGRETIDHPAGQHDDLANAAAGVFWTVDNSMRGPRPIAGR